MPRPKYTLLLLVVAAQRQVEVALDEETYKLLLMTPRDDGLRLTLQVSEDGELRACHVLM
jgi:hypothetical protein